MIKYEYTIDRDNPNYAANKILSFVIPGSRVLDVGCSSGYLARILDEEFGCTVTGLEIDPEAAAKAELVCESVIVGDVEKIDPAVFGDRRFDIVIFADVLEHLREPAATLRKAASLLAEDGFVIVSVPNFGYKGVLLSLVAGALTRTSHGILDDTHLQFHGLAEIFQLISDSGLIPVALERTIKGLADSEFHGRESIPSQELADLINLGPEVDTYQFIIKARQVDRDSLEKSADFMCEEILRHGALHKIYRAERGHFQETLAVKNRLITERDEVIAGKNSIISTQQQTIAEKNRMIQKRDEVIAAKNVQMKKLTEDIQKLNEELQKHWLTRVLYRLWKNKSA